MPTPPPPAVAAATLPRKAKGQQHRRDQVSDGELKPVVETILEGEVGSVKKKGGASIPDFKFDIDAVEKWLESNGATQS